MPDGDDEILFQHRGEAGIITLNRPQALNAVTLGMVNALARQLARWECDQSITRVVITAAPGRAFSAGGDLRALYDLGRSGRHEDALAYWRAEYALNALIKRYPKPYVALIDGIVMGGGAGISIHGSHRVAGNRFTFAMPEVGIGFFPDIGATWFLSRMPGALGLYCAMTGTALSGADAVAAGIATDRVDSERFSELTAALCGEMAVDAVLAAFVVAAGQGAIAEKRAAIDRLFQGERVEDILAGLERAARGAGQDADFARASAGAIRAKSPTSLKIALAQLRRGRSLDFAECMRLEFRIVSRLVLGHDFYEGIRSVIIDKNHAPHWQPPTLEAVSMAAVERYFGPLQDELDLS